MGFIIHLPGIKVQDLSTTNASEQQIWQELIMIRYLNRPRGISAKHATIPWIDQAKIYYIDASKSEWRASGLLYYYSFLNLAKAFLAAKRAISARVLKSSNIYHGLSATPQSPKQIIDFEIDIHPSFVNNHWNIFSTFYEKLTNSKWPHSQKITIKLSDILSYCREIGSEIYQMYGIDNVIANVQSLIREVNNKLWFELNVATSYAKLVQSHIQTIEWDLVNLTSLTNSDKQDWLTAFDRKMKTFRGTSFLRSQKLDINPQTRSQIYKQLIKGIDTSFQPYSLAYPIAGEPNEFWQFIPQITLAGVSMRWHPFLTDYLIAFILSTILRYHPHLLRKNNKDSYVVEAWCNQAPITAMRYFLMAITTPSIRYN